MASTVCCSSKCSEPGSCGTKPTSMPLRMICASSPAAPSTSHSASRPSPSGTRTPNRYAAGRATRAITPRSTSACATRVASSSRIPPGCRAFLDVGCEPALQRWRPPADIADNAHRCQGAHLSTPGSPTASGNPLARWVADRRVGTKILIAVSASAVVAVFVTVLALQQFGRDKAALQYVFNENLRSIATLSDTRAAVYQARLDLLNHGLTGGAAAKQEFGAKIQADDDAVDKHFAQYTATNMTGREQAVATFTSTWAEYKKVREERLLPL